MTWMRCHEIHPQTDPMILTDKQTNQKADIRVGGAKSDHKPTETGTSDETITSDGHEHTSDQQRAVMIRDG